MLACFVRGIGLWGREGKGGEGAEATYNTRPLRYCYSVAL
jgi:hypothetical protein